MVHFALLSRAAENAATDLAHMLMEGGFAVVEHTLGSAPTVEFESILVAIIEVGDSHEAALAQTRRWRAELGDEHVPVVWVLSVFKKDIVLDALNTVVDLILARPLVPELFLAYLRAQARGRKLGIRLATRAHEARLLGEQLHKVYGQMDREHVTARRIHQALLPQEFLRAEKASVFVSHRARRSNGGDFYDILRLDTYRLAIVLGDVIGCAASGSLIALFVAQTVAKKLGKTSKGIYGPGAVLDSVNKELLSLELEDQHVVALLVAILNLQTGELQVARAGLPMPIYLPASGEPETWMIAGPFLGTADASYSFRKAMLRAGDRLVMATDGTRPEANPAPGGDQKLLELSLRHRKHWGQGYVDALAGDLLAEVRHSDDFTLLCLELAKE